MCPTTIGIRVSGRWVATAIEEEHSDIYLVEVARGTLRRLTTTGANGEPITPSELGRPNYDVSPDGRSFVAVRTGDHSPATHLYVIESWFEELKRRVGSGDVPPRSGSLA